MRNAALFCLVASGLLACSGSEDPPPAQIPSDPPEATAKATPEAVAGEASKPTQRTPAADPARAAAPSATTDWSGPPQKVGALGPYFTEPELQEAVAAFVSGNNNDAAQVFEAFLDEHPEDPRRRPLTLLSALARHDGGVFDRAAEALEPLAADWPEMADYAWFYAGSAHHHAKRQGKAIAALSKVPAESTLYARAMELKARAEHARGETSAAVRTLETLVEALPDERDDAWDLLAELRGAKGDAEGAKQARFELASRFPFTARGAAIRKDLKADDLSPEQWLRLGRELFTGQSHSAALEALERAADRFPRASLARCQALTRIARTYDKMKRGDDAWPWYDKALGCEGDELADATFAGGRNRLRAKAYDDAEKLLQRHIDEFSDRTTVDDASMMLAEVHAGRDDDKKARAVLINTLERWPDGDMADEVARLLLWPQLEKKKYKAALKTTDLLLKLVPRETSYRAEGRTRYWRGWLLKRKKKVAAARAEWRKVLAEYPLSWYALLAYGRLAEIDPDEAEAAYLGALGESQPPRDDFETIPAGLWKEPHFKRAVELARMGLASSARRELVAAEKAVAAHSPGLTEDRRFVWVQVSLYLMAGSPMHAVRLARQQEPWLATFWPKDSARKLWEMAHPRAYEELVTSWAKTREIDPNWIWAIAREESNFNPRAVSWANAIGLMQIIMSTGRHLARDTDLEVTRELLMDPEIAVRLGSKYLAELLQRHPILPLASAGYNAGGGAVSKWRKKWKKVELDEFVERIPYKEARGYAKRVTRSVARYRWLYGEGEGDSGKEKILALPMGPVGAP